MRLSRRGEFTLLLAATLTIMVGAALAPGLNAIGPALGMGDYAPLLITLPALGAIMFAPLFGKLIDAFGARPVLLASLLGYCLLGVGGALLHGLVWITLDRIVLGGFTAGVMAAGTAEISRWYSGKARLAMIAKQGMAIELGGVIFLFIGGLLSELHWQAPFALYALGLICALLVPLSVPSEGTRIPAPEADTAQATASMRPVMLSTFAAMGLFFSMVVTLPELMSQRGYGEAETGYLLSFISLVAVIAAMLMPKMVSRTSERSTLGIAFVCFAAAHGLFSTVTGTVLLASAAICAGVGFGFSIPLLNHATVEISNDRNRGRNLSLFAMAVFGGQFVTSALTLLPSQVTTLIACALLSLLAALILALKAARPVCA
ncbi:MFS transporter [Granulosicoccaceae sp. 1_MG-2023]|nr:MFS transporter [Granulosicoccaceae sp. 1_MG-2023]